MTVRPILFSGPMVRALLDGRKTQTRRVVPVELKSGVNPKFSGLSAHHFAGDRWMIHGSQEASEPFKVPYAVNDLLWVREAFSYDRLDVDHDGMFPAWYWADGNPECGDWTRPKPSIHLPRAYSRLTLKVTAVKVQRLTEISQADAISEGTPFEYTLGEARREGFLARDNFDDGIPESAPLYLTEHRTDPKDDSDYPLSPDPRDGFRVLWDSLNAERGLGWHVNPWVVAVTFEVIPENVDGIGETGGSA